MEMVDKFQVFLVRENVCRWYWAHVCFLILIFNLFFFYFSFKVCADQLYHLNVDTQSAHSLCKVSHAIDSDAGDGSNREKFGRKDPGI